MSSGTPIVGSAFVEVHAKAAAGLQREIQTDVDQAAAKVQTHRESIGLPPKAQGAFDRSQEPERQAAAARLQERLAASRAAAEEKVRGKVEETGEATERVNKRTASSQEGVISGYARTAVAASVVGAAVTALTSTVGAFLEEGDKGRLKSEEDIRNYRELANGLDDLSQAWNDAKIAVGGFIAANVNPASTDFAKGLEALKNPLDTLSVFLGRNTAGTRDLAKAFADLEANEPSETFREIERRALATAEAVERAAADLDKRSEATVRAVGIQYEQLVADERVWRAQVKVNEARATGTRDAQRLADAERAISEARQAANDRAQDAVERERDLAEARRNLRIIQFEQGAGSQAALDAADAVQEAEFDAVRAHEEAGDAVKDVAKAERDAADLRIQKAKDLTDAQAELDDALRNSARTSADFRAAQLEAGGATVDATEKLNLYLQELSKFADTAGPRVRTELDLIRQAFESLPAPLLGGAPGSTGLDPMTQAMIDALGPALNMRPQLGPPAPGQVGSIIGPPAPVSITNNYYTPVDPAQIAREQAIQIGGGSSPPRMVR